MKLTKPGAVSYTLKIMRLKKARRRHLYFKDREVYKARHRQLYFKDHEVNKARRLQLYKQNAAKYQITKLVACKKI